jgi:TolB-like protein/Tfp pilus assembly protein PilF
MPANPNNLSQFWQELKRRKVTRVITVYAAAAFVILELVDIITEPFGLPDWTLKLVVILLSIGLIVSIIVSWIYDIHPEGGIVKSVPTQKFKAENKPTISNRWKITSYLSFAVILVFIGFNIVTRNKNHIEEPVLDKSIAVLPFEDMSAKQDQEYFCDGIAEEIINSLTQLDSLKVIARTSTFAFKNKQEDIREIGRILGVSTVLEGSVQKVGNRLRITAQLNSVEDGSNLWSEQYDREMEDVFIIQDEISEAIVEKLRVKLLGVPGETTVHRQTENPEAYNLYLKGRFFWHRRTVDDLLKSIQSYEQAIELDANYALAYAGLADVYHIMTFWGYYPREDGFEKGKTYAYRALSINNQLPEAHTALGGILTYYDWDWKGAERELLHAISLNPNDANAYQYISELMSILGRNKEARMYINRALELNPHSHIMYNLSADYYISDGAYEKAIEESNKSIEILQFTWAIRKFFVCNVKLGNDQEALENLKEIVSEDPSFDSPEMMDTIFLDAGIEGIIEWYIRWLQENDSLPFFSSINLNASIAGLYGLMGDSEQAIASLEKAFEAGESSLPYINSSGNFTILKEDPRFKAMLKELGL